LLSASIATTTLNTKNRVDSIEISTGSLNSYTSSNITTINAIHTSTSSLNSFSSSILGAIEVTGSNLTVKGNLLIKGTTTQIDSTTVNIGDNIIQLNGTGTSNGGLVVRDGIGVNIISGSLLWDTTLDYWKAGPLGSEERIILVNEYNTFSTSINSRANSIESTTSSLNSFTSSINTTIKNKLNSEGVVSGSLQIDITSTTGYSTFSSSISTSVSSLSSSVALIDNTQNGRLDSLETASGSIRTNFNSFTSSYNTGSFTGSFKGDGGLLYNIPASGVTGLNLTQIADGSVTASVSNTNGLRVNSKTEITGSLIVTNGITGSIDYSNITNKPTLVSGSSQIIYSGLTGIPSDIVSGSSQLTGSYDTRYVLSGSITQTTWNNIANKPSGIVSGSVQIINLGFATTSSNDLYGDRYLFTNASSTGSWVINHNLGYQYPNVDVYDSSNQILIPQAITATSTTSMQIDFATPTAGKAILTIGGAKSTGLFVQTGSYYNATNNIGITGSLVVTGDVDAANFNTTSDRKLKTNLVRIENALDKIEKLNGYTFDWLEEYSEDRSRQIGMVADEVYEVQPELISHRNIVLSNKEEKIKLLDYSKVTAILIEAIKELNDKVTKLENKKKKK
jgi:hypothetical protein